MWTVFLMHEETAARPCPLQHGCSGVFPAFTGTSSASTQAGTVCVGSEPFYLVCISCPRCDDSTSFAKLVMGHTCSPHLLPELRADGKSQLGQDMESPGPGSRPERQVAPVAGAASWKGSPRALVRMNEPRPPSTSGPHLPAHCPPPPCTPVTRQRSKKTQNPEEALPVKRDRLHKADSEQPIPRPPLLGEGADLMSSSPSRGLVPNVWHQA